MHAMPRSVALHRALFAVLLVASLGIQGCGLGWLYMRIGDSHRIRGAKILEYDTTDKRFRNAQDAYRRAIDYYRDSLLYDQHGNMDIYYKFGYTALQLSPPDLEMARAQFEAGLKIKREKADKEGRTDQLATTTDEDYSQINSGVGTVTFWTSIATKKEELLEEALKFYGVAEATTSHPLQHSGGVFDKMLDSLNLIEQLTAVPPRVLAARVYLYRAKKHQDRGHPDRAKTDFAQAKEAIDDSLASYPNDPRAQAELANMHYLKAEYDKCLKILTDLEGKRSYADKVEGLLLKGRALTEKGEPDKAIPIFTEIHERFLTIGTGADTEDDGSKKSLRDAIKTRNANVKETQDKSNPEVDESAEKDPVNIRALVGRAYAYGAKGDLQSATADIVAYLKLDSTDPRLYLDAGKVFMQLKEWDSAIGRLLKGYYITTGDITLNYTLGKAYQAAGKKAEMRDCFGRVVQMDPTSSYAREVAPLLR